MCRPKFLGFACIRSWVIEGTVAGLELRGFGWVLMYLLSRKPGKNIDILAIQEAWAEHIFPNSVCLPLSSCGMSDRMIKWAQQPWFPRPLIPLTPGLRFLDGKTNKLPMPPRLPAHPFAAAPPPFPLFLFFPKQRKENRIDPKP